MPGKGEWRPSRFGSKDIVQFPLLLQGNWNIGLDR